MEELEASQIQRRFMAQELRGRKRGSKMRRALNEQKGKFPNRISRELLGPGTEHLEMRKTPSPVVQQYRKAIY